MAAPVLRVEKIVWPEDGPDGVGRVWYEVTHGDGEVEYFAQPFVLGDARKDEYGRPLWGWNGSKDHMTLSGQPISGHSSFLSTSARGTRVHLTWTDGKMVVDPDSTVRGPSP